MNIARKRVMQCAIFCVCSIAIISLMPSLSSAFICETQNSGDWDVASTWSSCGGGVPGPDDDIIIHDTHTVNLPTSKTVNNVTFELITEGGISMSSSTIPLIVRGNWVNNGIPVVSTVPWASIKFTGDAGPGPFTIGGNSSTDFNNLQITFNSAGKTFNIERSFTTNGSIFVYASTIHLNNITCNIGSNLQLYPGSTLHAEASTVTIGSHFSMQAGSVFHAGTSTVEFVEPSNINITGPGSGVSFYNLTINKPGAYRVWLNDNVTVDNAVDIHGGWLTLNGYDLRIAGHWNNRGGAAIGEGTVFFTGRNQMISGNTQFFNLIKSSDTSDHLTFEAGSTTTISAGGTATLTGSSCENLLILNSEDIWTLVNNGTVEADYVDVTNSTASGNVPIVVPTGTERGGNIGWTFTTDCSAPPISNSYILWTK